MLPLRDRVTSAHLAVQISRRPNVQTSKRRPSSGSAKAGSSSTDVANASVSNMSLAKGWVLGGAGFKSMWLEESVEIRESTIWYQHVIDSLLARDSIYSLWDVTPRDII